LPVYGLIANEKFVEAVGIPVVFVEEAFKNKGLSKFAEAVEV
jgi:hypothetical protein